MRAIRKYTFNIGSKIPFSQWPEMVHCFLEENELTYKRFLYHFTDDVVEPQVVPKACERLQKDCPAIGESHMLPAVVSRMSQYVLTNIGMQQDFQESHLLPLMGKIHRTYGFAEVMLGYYDVNFFGRVIPFELKNDPMESHTWQLHGSAISLYRDAIFGEAQLVLSIDVLQDGQLLDAAPYCEAMQKLLPKVRVTSSLDIVMSEKEKQQVTQISQTAEPVLARSRSFLAQYLPEGLHQTLTGPSYTLASVLKKLGKKFGYDYRVLPGSGTTCILEKRTDQGHVLQIWVDVGPSHARAEIRVSFIGMGFSHCLGAGSFAPVNQQELDENMARTMAVVEEFRCTLLPELDASFPPCPDWFETGE